MVISFVLRQAYFLVARPLMRCYWMQTLRILYNLCWLAMIIVHSHVRLLSGLLDGFRACTYTYSLYISRSSNNMYVVVIYADLPTHDNVSNDQEVTKISKICEHIQ